MNRPSPFSAPIQWNRRKSMVAALLLLLGCNMAGALNRAVDALGRGAMARSNDGLVPPTECPCT